MPLVTFDDRNVEQESNISHVFETTTGSGNTSQVHYFDIEGDGFVIVTCSVQTTGSTSDYGSSYGDIYLNSTVIVHNYNRLTTANTENQGIELSAGIQVSDGDEIQCRLTQTKNGAKTFRWYCLCVGCTATYR